MHESVIASMAESASIASGIEAPIENAIMSAIISETVTKDEIISKATTVNRMTPILIAVILLIDTETNDPQNIV